MNVPFFSLIVPTLNEEKYISRLMEDLKNQKFKDFEVLIIDGKSKDATCQIVTGYSKVMPHVSVVHSPVRNLCYQRNLGGHKAKGRYLVFLDADIQLYANYLKLIHAAIKQEGALFLTTYQLPDARNRFDIFLSQMANYTLELLALINRQMAPGYNFIVEKKLFERAGEFDRHATFSEDHDLSIRIGKVGVPIMIIRRHLLKWSFRRIRKDGRLPIIMKYSLATIYMLTSGKITDKNFSYPMGGNYFQEVLRHRDLDLKDEFSRYLSKMRILFRELLFE